MDGARSIIAVIESLVAQMTPVIKIESNTADGSNWKLTTCRTYWATKGLSVTIGGESFKIVDFIQDEFITVKGAAQPVGVSFQLDAPIFEHGSHRKVDNERLRKKDLTRPFVYLPKPTVREDNDRNSDIAYEADIRPIFLTSYNQRRDKIDLQQIEVIEPMNAMADLFIWLINDQLENFNEPETITREEWMNFGDPTTWGNDALIFDQPISGVELRVTLEVLPHGVCECDGEPPVVCPDVTQTFQTVNTGQTTTPGGNLNIEVVNETDTPVGTLLSAGPNNVKIEVIGGGAGSGIYYNRPWLTQLTSYQTYDEGWRISNPTDINAGGGNSYNSAIPASGILQQINPNAGLDRLKYFNIWSHKFRFTGLTGGYCDPDDGLFYDVNGVLSDKATQFPFFAAARALIVDHLTGFMMLSDRLGAQSWNNWLPEVPGRTDAGYTDWFAPSISELFTLEDPELLDALNFGGNEPRRAQFNFSQPQVQSATTRLDISTQCQRFFSNGGGGQKNFSAKTNTGANRIFWRVHLTGTIPQP